MDIAKSNILHVPVELSWICEGNDCWITFQCAGICFSGKDGPSSVDAPAQSLYVQAFCGIKPITKIVPCPAWLIIATFRSLESSFSCVDTMQGLSVRTMDKTLGEIISFDSIRHDFQSFSCKTWTEPEAYPHV